MTVIHTGEATDCLLFTLVGYRMLVIHISGLQNACYSHWWATECLLFTLVELQNACYSH